MKRVAVSVVASLLSIGVLAGCGGQKADAPAAGAENKDNKSITLKIGASVAPHAEILRFAKPLAAKEGLTLEIKEFTDFVQPNLALANRELDANFFQHAPYLSDFTAARKLDLISVGPIHLEPLKLYSVKISDLKDLKDGDTVAIPADATNATRSLNVLAGAGLIKLKDGVTVTATEKDIVQNAKHLKIKSLDAEQLPRTLQDVAAAVINTNYYLEAQKNLKLDAKVLAQESPIGNPYANIVAVRRGDELLPQIKKLMQVLQSPEVKKFIEDTYKGAVLPAF